MKRGRKPKPPETKYHGIYVKLPPGIVKFLRDRSESQSKLIIDALKKNHDELKGIES